MDNDELLTRSLLAAMAGIVAWLAWVITGVTSPSRSVTASAVLGFVAVIGVFLICRALMGSTHLSDRSALARGMAAFVGFGAVAIAVFFADAPGLIVRILSTSSQVGCGLFVGFRSRAAAGGLGLAMLLSAIDTPFYGTVLLTVVAAVYLERNPLPFSR